MINNRNVIVRSITTTFSHHHICLQKGGIKLKILCHPEIWKMISPKTAWPNQSIIIHFCSCDRNFVHERRRMQRYKSFFDSKFIVLSDNIILKQGILFRLITVQKLRLFWHLFIVRWEDFVSSRMPNAHKNPTLPGTIRVKGLIGSE